MASNGEAVEDDVGAGSVPAGAISSRQRRDVYLELQSAADDVRTPPGFTSEWRIPGARRLPGNSRPRKGAKVARFGTITFRE